MIDWSVALVMTIIVLLTVYFLRSGSELPPGPWCWPPLIGDILTAQRSQEWHLHLMDLRRRYGNIFRLRFINHPVIVLNGHALIKEALVDNADKLSNRPDYLLMTNRFIKNKGVIFNTDNWKFTRKFVMSSLRDFGVGKTSLQDQCIDEIEILIDGFSKFNGKPFNCQTLLPNAVSNIICRIVFGKRFDYDDAGFQAILSAITSNFKKNPQYTLPQFIPYFADVLQYFRSEEFQLAVSNIEKTETFVLSQIEQHRETYDEDNIRDFTDLFIQSQKNNTESDSNKIVSEADALRMILDLFIAGTETTSTTLQWLIIYMMYNQHVQTKCREEIHRVIGTDKLPNWSDREQLVYTEATFLEVQRIATIAPLALPHTANCDMMLGGYKVPKDSFIIAHIYSCHRDSASWGDPDNFRPERWIDDQGKIKNIDAYIPFSLGKRACAGMQLAKVEMFMFGVSLIQRFHFKMADEIPSLVGICGTTLIPRPFEMIAEPCV